MILIIKLTNNVEIIGSIVNQTAKLVTIKDPVQINYKNIESSIPSVSLTRFVQFSKNKEHSFDARNVLCISEPIEQMTRYYETALAYFENEVDEIVKRELVRVVSTESDAAEAYTAILERLTKGKMLN